ncbi:glutathione transferase GstA [Corticibacter populi]|uniref:Glutathione transferase GstA n=1 Tax=Corticibacter populi TaxID=1550736 RepID=A0A3M6QPS6_9BURK|nr:glutathione transferase GstA [Corticibacter populi]RMX04791.1 glutathione transferase GstA [Corticibacter populi]RZS33797.1 glutathione S-transferase [Corticibacter populi]
MKLYYSPGACSLSPHIILQEAGLPHELVLASTKTHKLRDGTDFYTINPLGYVPVLELDDGRRLTEGVAIVQYLADQVPDKQLAPANGSFERYVLQSRLNFISTELHKNFGPLFKPGSAEQARQDAVAALQNRFQFVDNVLATQPYFCGESFGVADAYLFTVTSWTVPVKFDIGAYPHLQAHRDRVAARPAVQAALKAEGLLK